VSYRSDAANETVDVLPDREADCRFWALQQHVGTQAHHDRHVKIFHMLSFNRQLPALRLRDAITRPPHRLDRFSSSRSECISRLPNPFHYVNKLLARIVHGRTHDPGENDFAIAFSGNTGFFPPTPPILTRSRERRQTL
jgi:hypothetical protein